MVTGQPGTGKSTLINDLTSDLSDSNVVVSKLACTQLQADDLLRLVVLHFGLDGQVEHKALLLHNLSDYLQRLHRDGKRPLLIIDEAQDLSASALEELRLLTNLQHNNSPLLQIFLEELHKLGVEDIRSVIDGLAQEQLLPQSPGIELPEVTADQVAQPYSHTAEVINYPGGHESHAVIQTPYIEPDEVEETEQAPNTITQTQQHQMEIAIRLYTKLLRLLDGKPQSALLEVYLNFMDGQVINGTRLSIPYISLAAMGPAGFTNWLKSTKNGLRSDVREVLLLVYGLMQSDMHIE